MNDVDRIWTWAIGVGFALCFGCGSRPPASKTDQPLVVDYELEQPHAPAHFALSIPPHGAARVAAFRPLSANPDARAGFFGAPLGRERRAEIERVVAQGELLGRMDEASLEDRVGGALRLSRGNRRSEISLAAKDPPVVELRRILDGIVADAMERPVAALSLKVHARVDGPQVKIFARFVESGIQPIEIGVTRDDAPTESLALRGVLERGGRLLDEQRLTPADTIRYAAQGQLPKGWKRIETHASFELPPLGIRAPADPAGVYARVEATLSVRTKGHDAIDIALGSLLVSVQPEER